MPLLLIVAFILVPLLEIWVIIQVGGSIGVGATLALLIFDSLVGALLLRSQGRSAWVAFNRALGEGRVPAKEVLDGVLVIFGGALLLTPGFLTDALGLLLLIPPSRAMVRAFLKRLTVGRLAMGTRAAGWGYQRARGARRPRPEGPPGAQPPSGADPREAEEFSWTNQGPAGPRPDDIDGTAQEVRDEDELPPGERGSFPG